MTVVAPSSPLSRRALSGAAALVLLVALAYTRALGGDFLWDDDLHVTSNPTIVGPLGLAEIWTTARANYFPLVLTSFRVQHALWGLHPLGYHLVTLAGHALAALLLWRVLAQLRVPGAWLGAALWALHPVQVESVAWICELKNTQSAVFFLLAIACWLKWLETRRSFDRFYFFSVACSVFALLSKPSTVMLPAALALCVWWRRDRLTRADARALAPFFALSALAAGWTIWEQKFHSGAVGPEWSQTGPERAVIAGRVIWFYLGKLAWPGALSFIYPRWSIDAANPLAYAPLVLAVGALVAFWRRRGRAPAWRAAFFAAAFFVALLFPVLGFFDVYFFRYAYVGDHFQYLASIGPLALLGAALALAGGIALRLAGGAALGALALLTVFQTGDYHDRETLWRATLARNPRSPFVWAQLGGELARTSRHPAAIACLQRALDLNPNHPEALNHLGVEYLLGNRLPDAIAALQRAVAARPDFPEAHRNLGLALAQDNQLEAALPHLARAVAAWPYSAEAHIHLARALGNLDRWAEALAHYEIAARAAPDDPRAHDGLGNALRALGRLPEALPHFEQALKLAPARADVHDDFGLALAEAGRADEAMAQYERALQLDPQLASAHNNLGVALAQAGRVPDALAQFDEAVRLEPRYAAAHVNRGGALAALNRLPDARAAFARAVELQPDSVPAHTYLAQVLTALGREAEARAHFERAAELQRAGR